MKRQYWIAILVVAAFGAANAGAQSVADLARQERERQRGLESRAVFTNTDRPPAIVTPAQPAAAQPTEQPAAAASEETAPRDEQYWRNAFQAARADLKSAQDRIAVLELQLNELQTRMYRDSAVYNREAVIGAEITKTRDELAEARIQAQAAEQRIRDLQLELRRSGGPPGWARPQ